MFDDLLVAPLSNFLCREFSKLDKEGTGKWARAVLGVGAGKSTAVLDALDKSGMVAVDLAKYSDEGLVEKLGLNSPNDETKMIFDAIQYIHDDTRRMSTHHRCTLLQNVGLP